MSKPKYQHTAEELKKVSKVLDALNEIESESTDVRLTGTLRLWWDGSMQGSIDWDEDGGHWVYYPEASRDATE